MQAIDGIQIVGDGGVVRRVLVAANVDADADIRGAMCAEVRGHADRSLAVESKAVDDRVLFGEAEQPRTRIPGLRSRRDGTDLREAEPERVPRGHRAPLL